MSNTNHDSESRFITHRERLRRPFSWFHPTRAEFRRDVELENIPNRPDILQSSAIASSWNSRASRKRRYPPKPIQVKHSWNNERISDTESTQPPSPHRTPSNGWMDTKQRLRHPHSELKVHLTWDISFWVAVVFILGSTAWVSYRK